MPIQRWIHSAAGGTIQRLKPAVATVRSLSRMPAPAPDRVPLIVVIYKPPLQPPLLGVSPATIPSPVYTRSPAPLLRRTISTYAGIAGAFEFLTPDATRYADATGALNLRNHALRPPRVPPWA